jgi:hypothetical protein
MCTMCWSVRKILDCIVSKLARKNYLCDHHCGPHVLSTLVTLVTSLTLATDHDEPARATSNRDTDSHTMLVSTPILYKPSHPVHSIFPTYRKFTLPPAPTTLFFTSISPGFVLNRHHDIFLPSCSVFRASYVAFVVGTNFAQPPLCH